MLVRSPWSRGACLAASIACAPAAFAQQARPEPVMHDIAMGLADAPLIAARVEGVIYAVESNGIRSTLVKTAIGRLLSANVRIMGAVLTKFDARKSHYGYGYGYEYGYHYGRDGDGDNQPSQSRI